MCISLFLALSPSLSVSLTLPSLGLTNFLHRLPAACSAFMALAYFLIYAAQLQLPPRAPYYQPPSPAPSLIVWLLGYICICTWLAFKCLSLRPSCPFKLVPRPLLSTHTSHTHTRTPLSALEPTLKCSRMINHFSSFFLFFFFRCAGLNFL